MSSETLTKCDDDLSRNELGIQKAQWRGSFEGLCWTPWYPLPSTVITMPFYVPIKQVRVMIDGEWRYSPPGTTDPA